MLRVFRAGANALCGVRAFGSGASSLFAESATSVLASARVFGPDRSDLSQFPPLDSVAADAASKDSPTPESKSREDDEDAKGDAASSVHGAPVTIQPDGTLTVPAHACRAVLNDAFGRGGWLLRPAGSAEPTPVGGSRREFELVVRPAQDTAGTPADGGVPPSFVASYAEGVSHEPRPATATPPLEALKGSAMMYALRDLGALEDLETRRDEYLETHAELVPAENVHTMELRMIWRPRGATTPYPWRDAVQPPQRGRQQKKWEVVVGAPPGFVLPQAAGDGVSSSSAVSPAGAVHATQQAAPQQQQGFQGQGHPQMQSQTQQTQQTQQMQQQGASAPHDPASFTPGLFSAPPSRSSRPAGFTSAREAPRSSGASATPVAPVSDADDFVQLGPKGAVAASPPLGGNRDPIVFDPAGNAPAQFRKLQKRPWMEVLREPSGRSYLHWAAEKFEGDLQKVCRDALAHAKQVGLYGSRKKTPAAAPAPAATDAAPAE